MSIKIVYFATPPLAISCFEALLKNENFEVLYLVKPFDKPKGRGNKIKTSEIKLFAEKNNIKIIETNKISTDLEAIEKLKSSKPDFFVTFAFGQILSQEILDIPKATLNVHPSLLPKYRGSNPIATALLKGDKKSGITIAKTELALDKGDIILQKEIELNNNMNIFDLKSKISKMAPELLIEALLGLYENKIKTQKQDEEMASYTKKNTKEDKNLKFCEDCFAVHNKIRALVENFTCQVQFKGKILKILKSSYDENNQTEAEIGEIIEVNSKGISIKCLKGALTLETVKPEGKKEMSAFAWSLGSKIKKGDKFEN